MSDIDKLIEYALDDVAAAKAAANSIANIQTLARELRKHREALKLLEQSFDVLVECMECRGDEDCDHCEGIRIKKRVAHILNPKEGDE